MSAVIEPTSLYFMLIFPIALYSI